MDAIAIMQPTYMPWMGYFSMIDKVDAFVFLDDVQLVKRSWQVRNKIKQNDQELLLTIPIIMDKERDKMLINRTGYCKDINWKKNHLESIKYSYKKAKHFEETFPFIERFYKNDYSSIGEFNAEIISSICEIIGINTRFLYSSNFPEKKGSKDQLLSHICQLVGAGKYLSAQGSAAYIEEKVPGGDFSRQGIELYYHNYNHPVYNQLGSNFISHIGIYDLLLNEGFEKSLEIIRSGNANDIHYKLFRSNKCIER